MQKRLLTIFTFILFSFFGFGQTQIGQDIPGVNVQGPTETYANYFGHDVKLSADGNRLIVGSPNSTGPNAAPLNNQSLGHVKVFEMINGNWTQIGDDIEGIFTYERFGYRISLSSDSTVLAVGSLRVNEDGMGPSSGYVRVYKFEFGNWSQWAGIDSIPGMSSVSLSGDGNVVAIGDAIYDINNTVENIGRVQIYDLTVSFLSSNEFALAQFALFPNPTKNQFTIQLNEGLVLEKVTIYNNLGQFINSTQYKIVNTSKLSSGLYYVEVLTNKGKATKKLVIE